MQERRWAGEAPAPHRPPQARPRRGKAQSASSPACKPGSVEAYRFGRSFLWERGHPRPQAAYPRRLFRRGLLLVAYSALLRLGFAVPPVLPRARWALTPPFHPYPRISWAVCFLWHFPSPRCPGVTWQPVQGARTFLDATRRFRRDRPAGELAPVSYISGRRCAVSQLRAEVVFSASVTLWGVRGSCE